MRIPAIFHNPASRLLLTLGFLIALSLPSAAARKVRAIFIQPAGEALEKAVLFTGTEYAEIELPQRNFSPEVDLPAGELLVAILPKQLDAGAEVPAEAPKIKIPGLGAAASCCFSQTRTTRCFPPASSPSMPPPRISPKATP